MSLMLWVSLPIRMGANTVMTCSWRVRHMVPTSNAYLSLLEQDIVSSLLYVIRLVIMLYSICAA